MVWYNSLRNGVNSMANIYDVANFFIQISNDNIDDQITNLKLNKLLYYAQGCYLARTGRPLFDGRIEAWQYGPVEPTIYNKYKKYGSAPITEVDKRCGVDTFEPDELDTLLDVMREYGQYTGGTLVSMTHKEGTPWSSACAANEREISQKSMLDYFQKHPIRTDKELFAKIPIVTELPKEWYDPAEDKIYEAYQ